MAQIERDEMQFDVLIVGAGPSGLSAACRLLQGAEDEGLELSVCVVEKGSEVGAHIMSGAIFNSRSLTELFPDWQEKNAPLNTPVSEDEAWWLSNDQQGRRIPNALVPPSMHNLHKSHPHYVISAGNLCRWLAEQAEALGADIFPGFAAQELMIENGVVKGIITGDMGLNSDGSPSEQYMPGMVLKAKYTLFAEGARGHLGKRLIQRFNLDEGRDPQHYAIGFKELWDIPADQHQPGKVVHGSGWPLEQNHGGFYLYHGENQQVMVGLIVDLNYRNPHLSPFDEFQRMKHHPLFKSVLENGQRVAYGARAITKGGANCLPKMTFPGGFLLGCNAGTLNFASIKGIHLAMKSGLIAADTLIDALSAGDTGGQDLDEFAQRWSESWAGQELQRDASFGPAIHRYGTFKGGAYNWINQKIGHRLPNLHDNAQDHDQLYHQNGARPPVYPKPDGILSFDKPSSVFLSNTAHGEQQPCHLKLKDAHIPIAHHLPTFDEPAQRYCPAGVYEIIGQDQPEGPSLQINFQNCIHCKTCDIKDPSQNIEWTPPEGGNGPNYPNM